MGGAVGGRRRVSRRDGRLADDRLLDDLDGVEVRVDTFGGGARAQLEQPLLGSAQQNAARPASMAILQVMEQLLGLQFVPRASLDTPSKGSHALVGYFGTGEESREAQP